MIGHRRVKVVLSEDRLNGMFATPPGTKIVGCDASSDPPSVTVMLEGPNLPLQPFDTEAPIVRMDHEGGLYTEELESGLLPGAEELSVEEVAFMLFQMKTQAEEDWEGPVTMADWQTLTVESEREEFRQLARAVMAVVR